MKYLNQILNGNHLEILKDFPDNSIDLVITSPPYDDLRVYKGYIFNYKDLAKELLRVVKQGAVIVWVIKDAVKNGNRTLTSYKHALFFQEIGFNVFDVMIFSKTTTSLPHTNRFSDTFEYMFIFSKGIPKTINMIKDRKNKYAGTKTWGKRKIREKNGELSERGITKVNPFGIRTNIWEYSVGYQKTTSDKIAFDHPATFPEALVRDHIYAWSNEGDIVLDPMVGSGTTIKMAYLMNRNFIGIDISEEYCNISKQRLEKYKNKQKPKEYWDSLLNPLIENKQKRLDQFFNPS
jgi:site-specific DNA-methyltransferase (adenine-specific)